jgi:hypothetical protein
MQMFVVKTIFLNGLVCRLLGFVVKRREKPEQVLSKVRLHRGKSYWNEQSREQIVTTTLS